MEEWTLLFPCFISGVGGALGTKLLYIYRSCIEVGLDCKAECPVEP